MKKRQFSRLLRISVAILLLAAILSCVCSCKVDLSKEDIIDNISSAEDKSYKYVWNYLVDFGLPEFDKTKFTWAENIFHYNFNLEGGLPYVFDHARITAITFIEKYYDTIDKEDKGDVTDALITCYVDAIGDRYSVYRTPVEQEDYNDDMSGNFGGIGVVIEYDHEAETLMVSSVYIDSPAEKAGILVGDYIVGVDGKTIEEIGYLDVVDLVRGKIGTDVKITLKRGDTSLDVVATRVEIEGKTVYYEILDGNIGYVQIASFKENTFKQFAEAIDSLEASGVDGYIFDLRNNLGGLVSSERNIVSYLIPNGHPIISYQYKTGDLTVLESTDDIHPTKTDPADPSKPLTEDHKINCPLVVLCNEYTASASELFTAAMRDYNKDGLIKATIVGTKTYGKGIMQSQGKYFDGSTITLTVAYCNPPSGENYHIEGITPNHVIENELSGNILIDKQLPKAIEELKKLISTN